MVFLLLSKPLKEPWPENVTGDTPPPNPFTILNNAPTIELRDVISDLDLVMNNIDEHIDIFRTEEIARAAIAEALYKAFLEKKRDRHGLREDLSPEVLTMEVIDNLSRGSFVDPFKGGVDSNTIPEREQDLPSSMCQ